MSGYCDCACCDCFEIAIGEAGEAYCSSCEEAGCPDYQGQPGMNQECRAPHAYCGGDSRASEPDVVVDRVAHCPVCGQAW